MLLDNIELHRQQVMKYSHPIADKYQKVREILSKSMKEKHTGNFSNILQHTISHNTAMALIMHGANHTIQLRYDQSTM